MSRESAFQIRAILNLPKAKADRVFLFFAGAMFVIEAIVLALMPLSLAPDEAYYWDESRRLDIAYYEKGPIVPLIIRFFCAIFGDTAFGVRIGALLCQTLFSVIIYLFVSRVYRPGLGLLCSILLWSTLIFASQGLFITNDPPLSVLYLLVVVGAAETLRRKAPRGWIPTFFTLGIAIIAKYTALILYPGIFLFLLLTPQVRFHLKRPEFWIGTLLIGATLLPTVWWNIRHDWPQIGHNVGFFVGNDSMRFRPQKVLELLGGQWALAGFLTFPLLCAALWLAFREWRKGDAIAGLYVACSLPLALVCLTVSLQKTCYANWPMPMYIGAVLAFAHLTAKKEEGSEYPGYPAQVFTWVSRHMKAAVALNCVMIVAAHALLTGESFGIPRRILPMKKLVGWQELAREIEPVMASLNRCWRNSALKDLRCEHPALIAEHYQIGAELAFYLPTHPRVFIESDRETLRNQYDLWGGWEQLKGKDVLIVLDDPEQLENFTSKFKKIEPVKQLPAIDRDYDGELFVRTFLYLGRDYDGSQG